MSSPGPTAEQVAEALRTAADDFGVERVAGYDRVEHWERQRSGNLFFRFRADPGGEELLVKTGSDWSDTYARELYQAQADLSAAVGAAGIDRAEAIRPRGWTASPPLLVMPFVEGTDLVSLLRRPDQPEWTHMESWMASAGAMLAAFHRAQPSGHGDHDPAAEIGQVAARMRIRPSVVSGLVAAVDTDSVFASFGDFGPGNLMGSVEGRLYLIDPPTHPEPALFHRDLGNFVFELRRQLAGHGFSRTKPVRDRFDVLRRRFLDGYSPDLRPVDVALVSLFEMRRAAGMARKRFPGRPGDALWFARLALALRGEVSRHAAQSE